MLEGLRARFARAFTPTEDDLGSISLEDLRRALRSIEGKYNGFRDENRRLKAIVQELRDQVDRLEQELTEAIQLRESGSGEREELSDRITGLEAERGELLGRIDALESDLVRAREAVEATSSVESTGLHEVEGESSPPQGEPQMADGVARKLEELEAERQTLLSRIDELSMELDEARSWALEAVSGSGVPRQLAAAAPAAVDAGESSDGAKAEALAEQLAVLERERDDGQVRIVELEAERDLLKSRLVALADAASLEDQDDISAPVSGDPDHADWSNERTELLERIGALEVERDEMIARTEAWHNDRDELEKRLVALAESASSIDDSASTSAHPPKSASISDGEVKDLRDTIRYLEDELSGVAGEFEAVRDQYVTERDVHRKLRKEHDELQKVVDEYRTQGVPDPEEVQQLRMSTSAAHDLAREAQIDRDEWRARTEQAESALELTQEALTHAQASQAELIDQKMALESLLAQEKVVSARLENRIKGLESSLLARAAEFARDRVPGSPTRDDAAAQPQASRPAVSDAHASAIDRAMSAAASAAATVAGPAADNSEKDRLARLESEVAMLLSALKKQASDEVVATQPGVALPPHAEVNRDLPESRNDDLEAVPSTGRDPVASPVMDEPLAAVMPETPAPRVAEAPTADMAGDTQEARRRALRQMLQGGGR